MSREKICITIKKELLKKIDQAIIDGQKVRNRSHAIEYLISKALPSRISTAYILTGGEGVKMRPFSQELPKAMLPVRGRPILDYTLELLRNAGIRDIIILVGKQGDKLRSHFGDGAHHGVSITYIDEEKPSGTATPLKKAMDILKGKPFLLIYGDVLANIRIKDMIDYHEENGRIATMAVTSVKKPGDWGVVNLRGNKIVSFDEKPKKLGLSHLINAGIFVIEPEIFKYLSSKKFSRLENDVFPRLVKERKMNGYLFEGKWFDVGTPWVYGKVIKEWR